MKCIFIDESGDLGSKKASSKWFLFTAVITNDSRVLQHIIKRIWKQINKKHNKSGELHAYHEKDNVRRKVLIEINKNNDIKIICCLVDKSKIPSSYKEDRKFLYNKTLSYLIEYICKSGFIIDNEHIQIDIDRMYTQKKLVDDLRTMLLNILIVNRIKSQSVLFESSHENKSLQAVDFISWALFKKVEKDENEFFYLMKNIDIDMHIIPIKRMLPR